MARTRFRNFIQKGGNFGNNIDSSSFLESNSMIAKAAFITLLLIIFIICLSLGSQVLKWIFSPSTNPKLINGMKRGREQIIISNNPQKQGSIPILRSNDERYGVEFAWSVWLYINDIDYKKGERKHIFHKGSNKIGDDEKSIGVIAQEIEKVVPEVVKEDDKGMKSVAYGNISGLLIEAIKELKAEIEELKLNKCNCNK